MERDKMDILPRIGLTGKVVVVNGGGVGIGRSTCLVMAAAGANLAIVGRTAERLQAVAKEVRDMGRRGLPVVADVLYAPGVEKMIKEVLAEFGTIDVLVNVIGQANWVPALEMTEDAWDLDHLRNLKYVWLNAKAVAKVMIEQKKRGSIVSISSVSGTTASPGHIAYGAAKAGLIQMTKTMAVEWGPYGIRVNSVAPGRTRTQRIIEMLKDAPVAKLEASDKRRFALGRMAETDEIAGAVLCLASDLCSDVTGQTLLSDGGSMIMQMT